MSALDANLAVACYAKPLPSTRQSPIFPIHRGWIVFSPRRRSSRSRGPPSTSSCLYAAALHPVPWGLSCSTKVIGGQTASGGLSRRSAPSQRCAPPIGAVHPSWAVATRRTGPHPGKQEALPPAANAAGGRALCFARRLRMKAPSRRTRGVPSETPDGQ
jgi:hypothetical protein